MDERSVDRAGAPDSREDLLEAAEAVLAWLYDRRAHMPEELIDGREGKHRKRLQAAIRKARRTAA
jgi:hypothetical protein